MIKTWWRCQGFIGTPLVKPILRSLKMKAFQRFKRPNAIKVLVIFVVCSMGAVLFSVLKDSSTVNDLWTAAFDFKHFKKDVGDNFSQPDHELPKDKLLGGLLPEGFDEKSCLSRYQSVLYRKKQTRQPSSFLISRLRSYEALHKRCGPNTESYNRSLEYFKSGKRNNATDCNYVVWIALSGLGNKILTLASAFLYALLTNRVLLVDRGGYVSDLFCEPFPGVSWLLPPDFPVTDQFYSFGPKSPHSYGNMLKTNVFGNSTGYSLPPYMYLYLLHDYNYHDKLFFCNKQQHLLKQVPWLIMKSNQYFIPSLFLIQSFEEELSNLFPEKSTVFHFLGSYLIHPTNTVWGLITRYYDSYLAAADEKIGIQIRVFNSDPTLVNHILNQVLGCVEKENLLPQIKENDTISIPSGQPKTKAILITSLSSGYRDAIRNIYWEHPTMTGEVIQVFQPSHEEYQQTGNQMHNMKALAEIYLLSLTDKLVTSSMSTFGYVAQSLGGLKPWILSTPAYHTVQDPPCRRAVSMEPCFHSPPSHHNCKSGRGIDSDKLGSHVQHCEDRNRGFKLLD